MGSQRRQLSVTSSFIAQTCPIDGLYAYDAMSLKSVVVKLGAFLNT